MDGQAVRRCVVCGTSLAGRRRQTRQARLRRACESPHARRTRRRRRSRLGRAAARALRVVTDRRLPRGAASWSMLTALPERKMNGSTGERRVSARARVRRPLCQSGRQDLNLRPPGPQPAHRHLGPAPHCAALSSRQGRCCGRVRAARSGAQYRAGTRGPRPGSGESDLRDPVHAGDVHRAPVGRDRDRPDLV